MLCITWWKFCTMNLLIQHTLGQCSEIFMFLKPLPYKSHTISQNTLLCWKIFAIRDDCCQEGIYLVFSDVQLGCMGHKWQEAAFPNRMFHLPLHCLNLFVVSPFCVRVPSLAQCTCILPLTVYEKKQDSSDQVTFFHWYKVLFQCSHVYWICFQWWALVGISILTGLWLIIIGFMIRCGQISFTYLIWTLERHSFIYT